jgi:hypothetical protein
MEIDLPEDIKWYVLELVFGHRCYQPGFHQFVLDIMRLLRRKNDNIS